MSNLFRAVLVWLAVLSAPAFADRAFMVDADWLVAEMKNPKLVVLEVRYHPHRYHTVGHIPGAIQVQRFKDLGDNTGRSIMLFPSKDTFQATLRRWGINNDSTIVLYDDSRSALTARVYYLLSLYGYDMSRVKILDGGTQEWMGFNELTREVPKVKPGKVTLKPADASMFVEWQQVYEEVLSTRNPDVVLVDARPADMYTGKVIRHAVQGGHIPGAVNVVSLDATDGQSQKWFDEEKLAAFYKDVPKDKTVYVYCHDGFRMSLGWLQMKSLGYKDVRVLDGGWGIWDRAFTLPVVQGDAPYDDEFAL
ncbi:MAG: rhodanese-like domain-containing protein [Thiobacillus sp.]|nr:rhodanese-like domain-containing protein [Thiobacillus sp.]MDP2977664.1 rhodanese-like domain-containing protein [Thiobacillus sp.]